MFWALKIGLQRELVSKWNSSSIFPFHVSWRDPFKLLSVPQRQDYWKSSSPQMYLELFPSMTGFQAKFENWDCLSGILLQQSGWKSSFERWASQLDVLAEHCKCVYQHHSTGPEGLMQPRMYWTVAAQMVGACRVNMMQSELVRLTARARISAWKYSNSGTHWGPQWQISLRILEPA